MRSSRYLIDPKAPIAVPGFLLEKQRTVENTMSIVPCMISPNITPNRKGKVTIVKIAGFISLYYGMP
jgi:hypothetical protein